MLSVDLSAFYQSYPDKLAEQPGRGVAFGTGSTPWTYAAAIALGVGGDVRADSLDVVLHSVSEPVLLLVVDKDYGLVGERTSVTPKAGVQRLRVALPAGGAVLVVQAGATPRNQTVTVEEVVLNTVD